MPGITAKLLKKAGVTHEILAGVSEVVIRFDTSAPASETVQGVIVLRNPRVVLINIKNKRFIYQVESWLNFKPEVKP